MLSPSCRQHKARQTANNSPTSRLGGLLISSMVISALFVHGHTSPWFVTYSCFREAQWTLQVQNSIISVTTSYCLFRGGEKRAAQSKGQQYWSKGETTLKMWSTYVQWQNLPLRKQRRYSSPTISRYFKSVLNMFLSQPTFFANANLFN